MIALKFLMKFIGILNKNGSPRQVAAGLALGSIAGITPKMSLHNLVLLVLIFMVRVNVSAAFLSCAVFALLAPPFDPLFNKIGYFLLVQVKALRPFWTAL